MQGDSVKFNRSIQLCTPALYLSPEAHVIEIAIKIGHISSRADGLNLSFSASKCMCTHVGRNIAPTFSLQSNLHNRQIITRTPTKRDIGIAVEESLTSSPLIDASIWMLNMDWRFFGRLSLKICTLLVMVLSGLTMNIGSMRCRRRCG